MVKEPRPTLRDKAEKEKVEVKNQADQVIYQTEKTLGEVGIRYPRAIRLLLHLP
jgi:molecular chaperone DnaK (HSP70)